MRPHKGFRGYDGFFDPDNSDYTNFMADYGHLFKNNNNNTNVPEKKITISEGNSERRGRYYPRFTVKKFLKWWLISVLSCIVIFVIKFLYLNLFV